MRSELRCADNSACAVPDSVYNACIRGQKLRESGIVSGAFEQWQFETRNGNVQQLIARRSKQNSS